VGAWVRGCALASERQHVAQHGVRGVGQVQQQAPRLHLLHQPGAPGREPTPAVAVHGCAGCVVCEMVQAQEPEAGCVEHIQVVEAPLQRVRPLHPKQPRSEGTSLWCAQARLATKHVGVQLLATAQQRERAAAALLNAAHAGRLVQRALQQAGQSGWRESWGGEVTAEAAQRQHAS